eukprot:8316507-Pyramimonas_sp.AAC.1
MRRADGACAPVSTAGRRSKVSLESGGAGAELHVLEMIRARPMSRLELRWQCPTLFFVLAKYGLHGASPSVPMAGPRVDYARL